MDHIFGSGVVMLICTCVCIYMYCQYFNVRDTLYVIHVKVSFIHYSECVIQD